MVYRFRIVEEMIAGLQLWMEDKGYERLSDFQGRAVRNVIDWQHLNLNYTAKARIDQGVCIKCGYAACEDTSHQSIALRDGRVFEVIDAACVACNLCVIACPVEKCITMEALPVGTVDPRTGKVVEATRTGRTRTTRRWGRRGRRCEVCVDHAGCGSTGTARSPTTRRCSTRWNLTGAPCSAG